MSSITITDLFGNIINANDNSYNDTFILVNCFEMHSLLKKIYSKGDVIICDYDYPKLKSIFKNHDLNFNNYVMFGNVCITSQFMPSTLLFGRVENNVIQKSVDLEKIATFGKGSIWSPVKISGYDNIGVIYSNTDKKPKVNNIGIINVDFTVPYDVSKNNLITYGNEFGLLIHNVNGGRTLWRSKFNKNQESFKLLTKNGTMITKYNNDISLKNPQPYLQDIQYTVQGDLMMGDKCIASNDSSDVYLDTCNGKINQKWFPYKNKFISEKSKKCLTADGSEISMSTCDSEFGRTSDSDRTNDSQEWNTQETDFYLNKPVVIPGKTVVLVDSNDPWYINKNADRVPQKYKEPNVDNLNNHIDDQARFEARLLIDSNDRNLGYGYSRVDNVPVKCNIEGFGSSEDRYYNMACLIMILSILMFLYCRCKRKKYF